MINRLLKITCALMFIVVASSSCELQELYTDNSETRTVEIPIDIDWTKCGVTPQNVTVLIYESTTGNLALEHIYEHNSNDIQSYTSLPEGTYTAVIFNELRDQIDYLTCKGYENISTLKFEGNDDDPLRSRAATRSYIKQSGDLAVAMVEGIEVTRDMILEVAESKSSTKITNLSPDTKATVESLLDVVPEKKNTTIKIKAHIKNIYYARMPALVDLVNLSDGYYAYGDKNSNTTATLQFTMNNREYDKDSYFNGTISTTLTTFGTLTDRASTLGHSESTPVILDLLFKQIDAEPSSEVSRYMDVTSSIIHTLQSDGSYLITIDVSFEEELPVVEPEGSSGDSGFSAEVENWDEVDVPLQQ